MDDLALLLQRLSGLEAPLERIEALPRYVSCGRVTRIVGLVLEASGLEAAVGDLCRVTTLDGKNEVECEVIGFTEGGPRISGQEGTAQGNRALLMPFGELGGLSPGSTVEILHREAAVEVGPGLLGRVIDARGAPLDGKGPIVRESRRSLASAPINPLSRVPIETPLPTGVRAIDGPLTIGRGQRVGIFSGSGVGKSTLLGMIARGTSADLNVIALVGERGREVPEFIRESLGPEGLERSVVVVATGDVSALLRARAAQVAMAIAEDFRAGGANVLLMVDSITRVATAWREIGLAAGEPPTTKGYPPSVFSRLPRLLERAGSDGTGTITGVYTVLVEGDDFNEPIADAVRSILDGHIVLSRDLAIAGHLPAVDVLQSVSRLRDRVLPESYQRIVQGLQRLTAAYRDKEDLIAVGAYQHGSDPLVDRAIQMREPIAKFLRQSPDDLSSWQDTLSELDALAIEMKQIAEALA
jgi:flagellum-specific ATP synthase